MSERWLSIFRNMEILAAMEKAKRYNQGKIQMELTPGEALEEIARVYTFGALKYDAENWRKGFPFKSVLGSTLRHIYKWMAGEKLDKESGCHHLAHAAFGLLTLITFETTPERYQEYDDRTTYTHKLDELMEKPNDTST